MQDIFAEHTAKLREAADKSVEFHQQVQKVTEHLKEAFTKGKKVLIAGNGGSAAEATHFSDEFLGRYRDNRTAYPVVSLTADSAAITCIGNDFGFEHIFSRQIEGLGREGDVFIGLTTSGTSANILKAAQTARDHGMTVIAFTGRTGAFKDMADYAVISPSDKPAIVQEFHLHAIHLICEAFEDPSVIPSTTL